ncbi:hypothetical protein CRYPA_779 [uncultured Candidatus Thioglobus sp.]|nr:hypothetical protein CRYPA_779 [uncultured Candidatus Thioglobus sp.]
MLSDRVSNKNTKSCLSLVSALECALPRDVSAWLVFLFFNVVILIDQKIVL